MKKFRFMTNVGAIAIFILAFASIAQAQATRTWVSGVGDDANPCSRTAPCKTWAGAISKTASPGEIDALDPGGFGAVTITKSITIDGGGGQNASIVHSGVNGIVIQAGASDVVTIRNLSINGAGTTLGIDGIKINSGHAVHIEHCAIFNDSGIGIDDQRNNSGLGTTPTLFVNDTYIWSAAAGGISLSGVTTTEATIDHCHIHGNGFGVSVSGSNVINVLHSDIMRNTAEAVKATGTSSAFVTGCVLNGNLTGVSANGTQFLIMDDTILNNGTGVTGTVVTFGNNNVRANGGGNGPLPAPVAQQ